MVIQIFEFLVGPRNPPKIAHYDLSLGIHYDAVFFEGPEEKALRSHWVMSIYFQNSANDVKFPT